MTVTSCADKHMTSWSFLTLVLPFRWLIFRNFFQAVNTVIKQQQYCNTVQPQLNSERFTQHMTSQTWRLKRLFWNESFAFNTHYEHFYNLKRLYSNGYIQTAIFKRLYSNGYIQTAIFKRLYSNGYIQTAIFKRLYLLSQILWYKRKLFFVSNVLSLRYIIRFDSTQERCLN